MFSFLNIFNSIANNQVDNKKSCLCSLLYSSKMHLVILKWFIKENDAVETFKNETTCNVS